MTARDHLSRVAGLGCILCTHLGLGQTPATIHHLRHGQGMAQRGSDWLAIPLCREHHQGNTGLHGLGTRAFEYRYRLTELDLLAMTIAALAGASERQRSYKPPSKMLARP